MEKNKSRPRKLPDRQGAASCSGKSLMDVTPCSLVSAPRVTVKHCGVAKDFLMNELDSAIVTEYVPFDTPADKIDVTQKCRKSLPERSTPVCPLPIGSIPQQ